MRRSSGEKCGLMARYDSERQAYIGCLVIVLASVITIAVTLAVAMFLY